MKQKKVVMVAAMLGAAALMVSACGAGASGGSAEGTTLRLALNQSEQHPSYTALTHFADRLAEGAGGRWEIDVFPNETLGAQAEALQLVSDGTVDMAIVSGTQLENLNRDFVVFNLPTTFDSIEHQMNVLKDTSVVSELFGSLEDRKITVLGGFTQGTRNIYSAKGPVTTPEDLRGQKIRVQESELHIDMVKAMGASAAPMAYGEVYTALQSGVLDGAENNEVSYFTQKHHEVAKYYSRTQHLIGLDYLVINTDKLAEMTAEDRAVFDREWAAAMDEHTKLWESETAKAVADAEAAGARFSDTDTARFRAVLEPLVDTYVTTDSARKLYAAARATAR